MEDIDYKLEPVSATRVASEDIDGTFRSSCIGKPITKQKTEKGSEVQKGLNSRIMQLDLYSTFTRLTRLS